MGLRPPRRNNAPLVIFPVRVDNCDLQPVDQPERVNAALSVVESVIDSLYGWSLKDANRVCKSDAMQPDIAPILTLGPSVNQMYLHNVNIEENYFTPQS